MNESDKTTNAAGQAGRVPVGAEVLPTSQPVPAAPLAVEEVEGNWEWVTNGDDEETQRKVVDYDLALDLAKRLDSAHLALDVAANAQEDAEAALKELSAAPQSSEAPAVAWLVLRYDGTRELVVSPLTDETYMNEGDEAWPLYNEKALQALANFPSPPEKD